MSWNHVQIVSWNHVQKRSAKEGFAHAESIMKALEADYPGLWR